MVLHLVVKVGWIRRNAKAFRSTSMFDYDDDYGLVSWERQENLTQGANPTYPRPMMASMAADVFLTRTMG